MNHFTHASEADSRLASVVSARLLALLKVAASERNLSVDDWIETRLRGCLAIDFAERFEQKSPHLRSFLHRWIAGQLPFPSSMLPSLEALGTQLGGDAVTQVLEQNRKRAAPSVHLLYDEDAMMMAQKRISEKDLGVHFAAMTRHGHTRQVSVFDARVRRRVARLHVRAPHFSQATKMVLNALSVSRRLGGGLRLPPLLLVGPPATGKTWWAREVAKALGLPTTVIAMPKVTASFVLSGSTMAWSQARPGRVVEAFMGTDCASPLLILDEVDKTNDSSYAPAPVLLDLLDHESARHWRDEFFGCEFDVSASVFIATANHPEQINDALRSRFCQIRVQAPKDDQLALVIQSAWEAHRQRYVGLRLPLELPQHVVAGLLNERMQVRQLQSCFDLAIGRAASRRGALQLLPADFGLPALRMASSR